MKGGHVEGGLRLGPQPRPRPGRRGARRSPRSRQSRPGRGVEKAVAGGEVVAAAGRAPRPGRRRGRARRRRRRAARRAAGRASRSGKRQGAAVGDEEPERGRGRAGPTGDSQASPLRRAQAVKGAQGGPPKGKSASRAEAVGERADRPARDQRSSGSARAVAALGARREDRPEVRAVGPEQDERAGSPAARRRPGSGMEGAEDARGRIAAPRAAMRGERRRGSAADQACRRRGR